MLKINVYIDFSRSRKIKLLFYENFKDVGERIKPECNLTFPLQFISIQGTSSITWKIVYSVMVVTIICSQMDGKSGADIFPE